MSQSFPCPFLSLAIWTEIVYSWSDLGKFCSGAVCASVAIQSQSFHCCRFWTAQRLLVNFSEVTIQCCAGHCFRVWTHTDPMRDTFDSKKSSVIQSSKSEVSLQKENRETALLAQAVEVSICSRGGTVWQLTFIGAEMYTFLCQRSKTLVLICLFHVDPAKAVFGARDRQVCGWSTNGAV